MYPDRRIQAARRAALSRRLLVTQQAHALYGIDPDDVMPLGGWWTSLKKSAGRVTRKTVNVARDIGHQAATVQRGLRDANIPIVSDAAKAGLMLNEMIDKGVRAVGDANNDGVVDGTESVGGIPTSSVKVGLYAALGIGVLYVIFRPRNRRR